MKLVHSPILDYFTTMARYNGMGTPFYSFSCVGSGYPTETVTTGTRTIKFSGNSSFQYPGYDRIEIYELNNGNIVDCLLDTKKPGDSKIQFVYRNPLTKMNSTPNMVDGSFWSDECFENMLYLDDLEYQDMHDLASVMGMQNLPSFKWARTLGSEYFNKSFSIAAYQVLAKAVPSGKIKSHDHQAWHWTRDEWNYCCCQYNIYGTQFFLNPMKNEIRVKDPKRAMVLTYTPANWNDWYNEYLVQKILDL